MVYLTITAATLMVAVGHTSCALRSAAPRSAPYCCRTRTLLAPL